MANKFSVVIISCNQLEGEVYEFDSFKEANDFANSRRKLYDEYYNNMNFTIFHKMTKPKIYVSGLQRVKKKEKQVQKCNEINEKITGDILDRMEKSYMRQLRRNITVQDMNIIKCYEKSNLLHKLYGCLIEEDEERLRESLQNLTDEILNEEVMPTLIKIGYVF